MPNLQTIIHSVISAKSLLYAKLLLIRVRSVRCAYFELCTHSTSSTNTVRDCLESEINVTHTNCIVYIYTMLYVSCIVVTMR